MLEMILCANCGKKVYKTDSFVCYMCGEYSMYLPDYPADQTETKTGGEKQMKFKRRKYTNFLEEEVCEGLMKTGETIHDFTDIFCRSGDKDEEPIRRLTVQELDDMMLDPDGEYVRIMAFSEKFVYVAVEDSGCWRSMRFFPRHPELVSLETFLPY